MITRQGVPREQPMTYSHQLHAGQLGIDCRYCHTSVDRAAKANIPPTATCMNCHKLVKADSVLVQPVRESYGTGSSIAWTKVHDLPDFVYFNHEIHVHKGIGCATCHGRIDQMPVVWQHSSLQMEWCLDCHRNPENYVRPRDQVFNMAWTPPVNQLEAGQQLVKAHNIQSRDNCSICHR
jgi:NAD-dependent SIR2 family protein deacetylase